MVRVVQNGCCAGCSQRVLVYCWWALNTVSVRVPAEEAGSFVEHAFLSSGYLRIVCSFGNNQFEAYDGVHGG